jgi:ATP-dependent Lon protease
MYVGFWIEDLSYKKGDIVFVGHLQEYFICVEDHISSCLMMPSKEDIYWLYVSSSFLNQFALANFISSELNDNNNQSDNSSETTTKSDELSKKTIPKQNAQDKKNIRDKKKNAVLKINTSNLKNDDECSSSKNEKSSAKRKQQTGSLSDDESLKRNNDLKRKIDSIEDELADYKKKKFREQDEVTTLRDRLLLMNIDMDTKSFIMDKYDNTRKLTGSDYSKGMNWLKTVSKIPYGKYKKMSITKADSAEMIKKFFFDVKQKLDKNIYGLEDVKQEILEFVAKKITNPDSKGHVLALYGAAGVGKTKIIRSLADALDMPFYQINFGGLNDVSVLTGHSETYVGSKPGKIVEILSNSEYMNPIIYMDEIDKISENKFAEISGVLTHLLDEEQNRHFQDNYLSNIDLDLSKVFFVLAFNDITRVDEIVSDRLKVIYIDPPKLEDKITICQDKMIPEILKSINLKEEYIVSIDKEVIEYIVSCKTAKESGVRQLRKNIEKIVNRLNYDILIDNYENFKKEQIDNNTLLIVTRSYVDFVLKTAQEDTSYLNMYL